METQTVVNWFSKIEKWTKSVIGKIVFFVQKKTFGDYFIFTMFMFLEKMLVPTDSVYMWSVLNKW